MPKAPSMPSDQQMQMPPLSLALKLIIRRDLLLAFRQRNDLVNPLFFFIMVVTLFPLGLGPEPGMLERIGPGVLWIAALLSTLLSVDSLFRQDHEDGSLELLLQSPHPFFLIVLGKVAVHWLVSAVPLILISPFLAAMLFLDAQATWVLVLSLLLGTPVLSMVSAIGAALTVGLRKGGVLVAIIALPLYIPVLIFGTGAVEAAASSLPYGGQLAYLGALASLAVTFAPFAIAAGVRVSCSY